MMFNYNALLTHWYEVFKSFSFSNNAGGQEMGTNPKLVSSQSSQSQVNVDQKLNN